MFTGVRMSASTRAWFTGSESFIPLDARYITPTGSKINNDTTINNHPPESTAQSNRRPNFRPTDSCAPA